MGPVDETAASAEVERARGSPVAGVAALDTLLGDATLPDGVRSILLRGRGDVARWVETIEISLRFLQEAITVARRSGRPDLVSEAQLTLAGSQHLGGDLPAALSALDEATVGAGESLAARIDFQRATILAREGRVDEALASFDAALRRFIALDDRRFIASTLGNRGLTHLERGDVRLAQEDLGDALAGFHAIGLAASAAWMRHNLGRVAGCRGDVVAALAQFRDSESALRRLKIDAGEVQVNRCEVLLEHGLYVEAAAVARQTESQMASRQLEVDRGEAVVAWALGLMGQGRFDEAAALAATAAATFDRGGRQEMAARARLVELSCLVAAGVLVEQQDAIQLARRLQANGNWPDAARAWAVVARQDPALALRWLRALPIPADGWPVELQLIRLEVETRERLVAGDVASAMASTLAAAEIGRRRQAILGTADLRAAVSAQLDTIGQLGLELRLDTGRAWSVLRWVDRIHVGSTSPALPAAPTESSAFGELLGALRAMHRAGGAGGDADEAEVLRRQVGLQRRLIGAHRLAFGSARRSVGRLGRDLREVADGVVLVQYHRRGDVLGAVVVDRRRARIVQLGSIREIDALQVRLLRAVRRLAGGDVDPLDAIDRYRDALSSLLVPAVGDDPMVVVPLARHHGLPWALLDPLGARPITIAPTLRHWHDTEPFVSSPATVVGVIDGVHSRISHRELSAIRRAWSGRATVRRSTDTAGLKRLLTTVEVAHVACHGDRRFRDGRFARLRVDDGEVTSLELETFPSTPRVVILAACDAGLLEALPGDETAGLATALFAVSTDTIVAPMSVLGDTAATAQLFGALHRHLAAGSAPAQALFDAQQSASGRTERVLARTVSCFGRG